jgi:hypothetical protein
MKRTATLLAVSVATLLLASCQTWSPPYSEISGIRYTRTDPDRFPVSINAVDGGNPGPRLGYGREYPYYRVDPGTHVLAMQALNGSPNWVSGINRKEARFDLAPCMRYYLNAQFDNRLLAEWKPVIDYAEPIAGCNASTRTG